MNAPDNALELHLDETLLHSWRISARSFCVRAAALLLVTALICAPLYPVVTFAQWLLIMPLSALFYMWVFGDFRIWSDNRHTQWHLSNQALLIAPDNGLDSLRLPLTEIRQINRWPLWSLVLRLQTGPAIVLPIPPEPRALRRDILDARDAFIKGAG